MTKPTGTPYTLDEVVRVIDQHAMDEYHRELMKWLVWKVREERARFHFNKALPTTWEWEAVEDVKEVERARAARIARESVAADLAEKFPDARRLADQIAADIEGDQV